MTLHSPAANPPTGSFLRWFTLIEALVLLVAGGSLFFAPDFANTIWAWALTPFNTRFLGAIYLSSMAAVLVMWYVGRWSPARAGLRVIFAFTLVVLVVSVVYINQFDFQRPGTWLWFGLYVALPASALYHLWLYRHLPDTHLTPMGALWRNVCMVSGIAFVLYGAGLLVLPAFFSGFWTWALDDFHGRLYSATFIGGGVGLLSVVRAATSYELITAGVTQFLLGLLAIVGLLIVNASLNRVDWSAAGTWLWLLIFGGMLLLGLSMMALGWRITPRY